MTAALQFCGVGVRLGGREILRSVDLEVAAGELVALAGPNGAGKTTLLRVASRVLEATRGEVRIDGRRIGELPRRELARRLAVVPQDAQIAFSFRVGEIVLMGRSPHIGAFGFESRADVTRAEEAMARVGIESWADRSISELSGGERQLVMVARALAQDPQILLLDEPTAHLDLRHRIDVVRLVREFVSTGRSALIVSHDLSLAAHSCDRVALLGSGELLAVGTPEEVITPEMLRRAFGIEAAVIRTEDGQLLVAPRIDAPRVDRAGPGPEEAC